MTQCCMCHKNPADGKPIELNTYRGHVVYPYCTGCARLSLDQAEDQAMAANLKSDMTEHLALWMADIAKTIINVEWDKTDDIRD